MTWRKVLVRGLVFMVAGSLVVGGIVYRSWTNPRAVRQLVHGKLADIFQGADVRMESAHLRLLGGIAFSELRMARRDDLSKEDFLYVPSGIIYHDKERMLDGAISVRKIEIQRPRLRIIRERDGTWNLKSVVGEVDINERMPTMVVHQGSIILEYRSLPGTPLLEIRELSLTLINDPLPVLSFEGKGKTDVLGPIELHGTIDRLTGATSLQLDLAEMPVGPTLVQRLSHLTPEVAVHLRQLRGIGKVQATFEIDPTRSPAVSFDALCSLRGGYFAHASLPLPLEQVDLNFRCLRGRTGSPGDCGLWIAECGTEQVPFHIPQSPEDVLRIPSIQLDAWSGTSRVEASASDVVLPCSCAALASQGGEAGVALELESMAGEWKWQVDDFELTPHVWTLMPASLQNLREEYQPEGRLSVGQTFTREKNGQWRKRLVATALDIKGEYHEFRYPVHQVKGTVELEIRGGGEEGRRGGGTDRLQAMAGTNAHTGSLAPPPLLLPSSPPSRVVRIDLTGRAGTSPFSLKGKVEGEGNGLLELTLIADRLTIDEQMMNALAPRSKQIVEPFHPTGTVHLHTRMNRAPGEKTIRSHHVVTLSNGTVVYDEFPLPLKNVSGVVEIGPNSWVCRDVKGYHEGAELTAYARPVSGMGIDDKPPADNRTASFRIAQPEDPAVRNPQSATREAVFVSITGKNLPIDQTLEAAIAPNGMPGRKGIHQAWKSLDPTGRLYFTAEVINRPDAIQPLDIKLSFAGPSVRPRFFSYPLQQVSGTLHYHGDRVDLTNFRGIHGTGSLAIKEGTVFLKHNGSQQVRLPLVQATDLPVDADLLSALPASLRKGLEAIKLQGPVNMVGALVADPPEPGEPPVLWWNGLIQLQKASFSTGLRWSDVTGKMWCCGRYDGTQVESIVGGVELEQARVLGQTLRNVRCRLEVDTDSPETLRLRNLNMDFCGGTIGGEARLDFAPTFQYDVYLKALQIDLEQFGRANDLGEEAELQGAAMGAIHLMGKGNDLGNLRGNGRIDIPQGKLYQLPLLLDLVKAFGLRVPDRTAFEQAHSSFSFEGSKMHFEDLNLVGNAISLRGRGSSDLDGTNLNLDFHADWARMGQLLPPGVTEIPRAISNQLFKIKMRGRIGETRFEKEFIPGVMEPIKRMIGTQE